jgi:hypothetical protein
MPPTSKNWSKTHKNHYFSTKMTSLEQKLLQSRSQTPPLWTIFATQQQCKNWNTNQTKSTQNDFKKWWHSRFCSTQIQFKSKLILFIKVTSGVTFHYNSHASCFPLNVHFTPRAHTINCKQKTLKKSGSTYFWFHFFALLSL